MRKLFGIVTPAISPLAKGAVDRPAVSALVGFARKIGVAGVFPAGSTGCAPLLGKKTHMDVIGAFADADLRGMKLYAGVGRNSIAETLEVADFAIRKGCDAVVIVTPYYIPLGRSEVMRYYDVLLGKIDTDVIAYNIPQMTGNTIDAGMIKELRSRHRNLVGVKDSSKDMAGFKRLCIELPESMMVFQGQDDLLLRSLRVGASGGVCGTTNFSAKAVEVFSTYKGGELKKAAAEQQALSAIIKGCRSAAFPTAYHYLFYKRVMHKDALNITEPFGNAVTRELRGLSTA